MPPTPARCQTAHRLLAAPSHFMDLPSLSLREIRFARNGSILICTICLSSWGSNQSKHLSAVNRRVQRIGQDPYAAKGLKTLTLSLDAREAHQLWRGRLERFLDRSALFPKPGTQANGAGTETAWQGRFRWTATRAPGLLAVAKGKRM